MMSLFDYLDVNGDGCIDREEFKRALIADPILHEALESKNGSLVGARAEVTFGQSGNRSRQALWLSQSPPGSELDQLQGWLNEDCPEAAPNCRLSDKHREALLAACHANDDTGFGYCEYAQFSRLLAHYAEGEFPEGAALEELLGGLEGVLIPAGHSSPQYVDFVTFCTHTPQAE